MNVTVENLAPCKRLVRVEIEPAKVDAVFGEITAGFQREARLPGFRPGKAPKDMVAKRYQKEIEDEAKTRLMQEGFRDAVKENKITVVGSPDVEDIQFGRGVAMQFAVTTEVAPNFELPEYKGLEVKRETGSVTPEDIDRALKVLADQRTEYKTVAREVAEGDVAVINYTGTVEGKPITELSPTAKGLTEKKNFWVPVDATSFIPGFGSKLAGMKAGEKRTISIDFPADFVVPQLVGKKGDYEVELVEAKEKIAPAIDETFAKSFGVDSLDKLREGVRADLQNELNNKQIRSVRNQAAEALVGKIEIPLPETMVEQETQNVVYNIVHENTQRGMAKDALDAQADQIYATAKGVAQQRVKAHFIFQAVAAKEGIRVEQMEVFRRLQEMAAQYKMPFDKFYKDMEKSRRINDVVNQIQSEKVIDLLVQFARIEDVAPAPKA